MGARRAVLGLFIFALVAVVLFMILNQLIGLNEGVSVLLALLIGFLVEWLFYRKKQG
ncbi:hypothetical protein [Halalkalibacterium ligniniphilum]|uniref:hypothetical protein n=1 Tax=Halalkalibacterium ligniniphilum TaxID=1134413 RepID=UPI000349433C|nr:hypothetical protein [Halalkalibacterium ligniniphilum]